MSDFFINWKGLTMVLGTCATLLFGAGVVYNKIDNINTNINILDVKIDTLSKKTDKRFDKIEIDLKEIRTDLRSYDRRTTVLESK